MTSVDLRPVHRTSQPGGQNGSHAGSGEVGKAGCDMSRSMASAVNRLKSLNFIGSSSHSGLPMSHSLALIRDWQRLVDSGL
jgi:hypothetical protein